MVEATVEVTGIVNVGLVGLEMDGDLDAQRITHGVFGVNTMQRGSSQYLTAEGTLSLDKAARGMESE